MDPHALISNTNYENFQNYVNINCSAVTFISTGGITALVKNGTGDYTITRSSSGTNQYFIYATAVSDTACYCTINNTGTSNPTTRVKVYNSAGSAFDPTYINLIICSSL